MKTITICRDDFCVADRVRVADRFFTRFRGLMLRKRLAPGEGLLLTRCGSIHCCFMRFPIDAVYLDAALTVIGTETVHPWHLGGHFRGAKQVLELGAGSAEGLLPGMRLHLEGENA